MAHPKENNLSDRLSCPPPGFIVMIGLSSEDSRIIEDALWRIVSNSHSDPKKQNDDQNR